MKILRVVPPLMELASSSVAPASLSLEEILSNPIPVPEPEFSSGVNPMPLSDSLRKKPRSSIKASSVA